MFELQKTKAKPARPTPQLVKVEAKPSIESIDICLPKPNISTSIDVPVTKHCQSKELDWGDDDSMNFDAVSQLMTDTTTLTMKMSSPPRISSSLIQFDTQELEFVTDEQLIKSARTFHTSPMKEANKIDVTSIDSKDEHLRIFWFDAYEDAAAQPG
jgi:hypothetical protein